MKAIVLGALAIALIAAVPLASADSPSNGGPQRVQRIPPRPGPPPSCRSQRQIPTLQSVNGKQVWVCVTCPPPRRPWLQGLDAYGYPNWICKA
ncbi:MAG: hypothetical protein ACHP84_08270 [Caulobacterales bacterium]